MGSARPGPHNWNDLKRPLSLAGFREVHVRSFAPSRVTAVLLRQSVRFRYLCHRELGPTARRGMDHIVRPTRSRLLSPQPRRHLPPDVAVPRPDPLRLFAGVAQESAPKSCVTVRHLKIRSYACALPSYRSSPPRQVRAPSRREPPERASRCAALRSCRSGPAARVARPHGRSEPSAGHRGCPQRLEGSRVPRWRESPRRGATATSCPARMLPRTDSMPISETS